MRTHDLEADADLWKDGFFSRRITRYVCLSKTQGRPEHIVESILILHDKEFPPEGYSIIASTSDTNTKAFKKKQICYKLTPFKSNSDSIVDVIILSKLKNPPDGYDHVGDVNGMHFCTRKISALTRLSTPGLSYGVLPGAVLYPKLNESMGNISLGDNSPNSGRRPSSGATPPPYPTFNNNSINSSPAHQPYPPPNGNGYALQPHPSAQKMTNNTGTLTQLCGLDGVPFQLREDLRHAQGLGHHSRHSSRRSSLVSVRSQHELDHKVKSKWLQVSSNAYKFE